MALRRRLTGILAIGAVLALGAQPALAAATLSISRAHDRAERFAENTCRHDKSCTRSGVLACRRHAPRVVLCRIFDRRETEAQGNFRCTRIVRLSLDPRRNRVRVTGVSNWQC
jgi:hypothetical protein